MPGLSSAGCATRTSVECLSRREHPGIPVHHRHVDCSRRCSSAGASAPADGQRPRGGRIRVGDNTQGSDATHNRARSARRIFNVRRADCANDDAIIDSQRELTAAGRISATAEFDAAHRRRIAHCNRAARGRRTFDLRSTNGKRRPRAGHERCRPPAIPPVPAQGSAPASGLVRRRASSAGWSRTWCIGTPGACPDRRSDTPSAPSAPPRGIRKGSA